MTKFTHYSKNRAEFALLIDCNNYKIGAEIGVGKGAFSQKLLRSKLDTLYSIDIWDNSLSYSLKCFKRSGKWPIEHARCRLSRHGSRSVLIQATSEAAASQFDNESLDFIYIDADHSYLEVKNDLGYWWPKLRAKGALAGHDYQLIGVQSAVLEFSTANNLKLNLTNATETDPWPSWWFYKRCR